MSSVPLSPPKPTVLVTGSAGHLGKALMLALPSLGYHPVGIDIKPSETTTLVGSITDPAFISAVFSNEDYKIEHVIHAATLHKPHVGSHSKSDFVQINVAGTLNLLEQAAAAAAGTVKGFVYVSTTSAFGAALNPAPGRPAVWFDDAAMAAAATPKNIYGATKAAAEDLCALVAGQRDSHLPVLVLRTSRFFPEEDDDEERRAAMSGDNLKVLELAYRRVDIADVVTACVAALRAMAEGRVRWGKYVVSGPTPFRREPGMLKRLDEDAGGVFREVVEGCGEVFERRGWKFLERVDRVYDSSRAIEELGWRPEYTFERAVQKIAKGEEWRSELSLKVGKLGYHDVPTGVYTVREEPVAQG